MYMNFAMPLRQTKKRSGKDEFNILFKLVHRSKFENRNEPISPCSVMPAGLEKMKASIETVSVKTEDLLDIEFDRQFLGGH